MSILIKAGFFAFGAAFGYFTAALMNAAGACSRELEERKPEILILEDEAAQKTGERRAKNESI